MIRPLPRFWRFYLPPFIWAALIFWNSSRPHLRLPHFYWPHIDKALHFGIYFILGFLMMRAFCLGQTSKLRVKNYVWGIVLGSLFGLSDEFHQCFVPGRSADIGDLIADILGILAAQLVIGWIYRRFFPPRAKSA
ncbi:VanZ family protein [candidate division KSB1 bacterium]|nr:VanZ family protein [candidate division KSB1 bacterium]